MTEQPRITAAEYRAQNARIAQFARGKKAHKYGAKAKEVDGITFPSTAEARRYEELKLMQSSGAISALVLQPRFKLLSPRGDGPDLEPIGDYVADFQYITWGKLDGMPGGKGLLMQMTVVEDVKGVATAVYRLKLRLFKAQYPHLIFREIKSPRRRRRKKRRNV